MDDGRNQFCREFEAICPFPEVLGIRPNFGHWGFRPDHHVKIMKDEHGGTSHNESDNDRPDISCNFHVAKDNRTAILGEGLPSVGEPKWGLVAQARKALPPGEAAFFASSPTAECKLSVPV